MSAADTPPPSATELLADPLLRDAPTVAGFKVLDPAVLYAKVGQGGMGAVYRGRHFKLDLDVAVKCLRPALCAESPDFVKRFEREARLAASLGHQNVVRVMDVFERHGLHYLVMEFVAGESARQRVLRKGALGEQEALAIVAGAAAGLAEAHQRGIVHRDIKPDNVLISHEGRVKLADLGLAKAATGGGEQSISLASGVMGTPQYMAPEQWETPDVGPTADVWALGATLWYLLVGRHALDGSNLAALARRAGSEDFPSLRRSRPGLTEATCELVERCVARDPARRFGDARALHKALQALVTIDEAALADGETAIGGDGAALVTPPTRQMLSAIRTALDTGVRGEDEARTVPSPGQTMPLPPPGGASRTTPALPRRRRWPWLLAAALLLGAGGAWAAGWFGDDTNWEEVERYAKARRLFWEAKDLLPQPDGLDAAIDKFEEVLALWPDYEIAREPLAQALDKRAERLQANDPDGAFVAAQRAAELVPADARVGERRKAIEDRLRQRLFAGFSLVAPELPAPSQTFVVADPGDGVRGRVTSPGFTELQVRWLQRDAVGDPAWTPVAVVAGEFALTAPRGAGDQVLEVSLRDRHGVGGVARQRVRIAGGQERPSTITPSGQAPKVTWFTAAGNKMLAIAPGTFPMGSHSLTIGRRGDEQQHTVTLVEPFWLAETEVTRAEWLRIMDEAPWPADADAPAFAGDLPASFVDHAAAQQFCERLTGREGAAGRLPQGYRYCLPSEAQWEFAARGGSTAEVGDDYGAGIERKRLGEWAVFETAAPQLVRGRKANGLGFHDMLGNVAEWCADFAMPAIDGSGVVTATYRDGVREPLSILGGLRVHRGGSHASAEQDCRVAARAAAEPALRSPQLGFRVALAKR